MNMLAARKRVLEAQNSKLPPFSYSGSWETGNDGWDIIANFTRAAGGYARTGTWQLQGVGGYGAVATATFTVPAEVCAGLTITAVVWHRATADPYPGDGLTTGRSLAYRIGSGSFVSLGQVTNATQTHAQFSGTFNNAAGQDVTIRIQSTASNSDPQMTGSFDDWMISGI